MSSPVVLDHSSCPGFCRLPAHPTHHLAGGYFRGLVRFGGLGVHGCAVAHPRLSPPPFPPQPSLVMIPLHLSLVALSCLILAGAEPFHIPLVRRREPLTIEDYVNAGNALRYKYGHTYSPSKRQNTDTIPLVNQVILVLSRKFLPPH